MSIWGKSNRREIDRHPIQSGTPFQQLAEAAIGVQPSKEWISCALPGAMAQPFCYASVLIIDE
jgi:hypothetical protein